MKKDLIPLHLEQTIHEAGQAIHQVNLVQSGRYDAQQAYQKLVEAHDEIKHELENVGKYLAEGTITSDQNETLQRVNHQINTVIASLRKN